MGRSIKQQVDTYKSNPPSNQLFVDEFSNYYFFHNNITKFLKNKQKAARNIVDFLREYCKESSDQDGVKYECTKGLVVHFSCKEDENSNFVEFILNLSQERILSEKFSWKYETEFYDIFNELESSLKKEKKDINEITDFLKENYTVLELNRNSEHYGAGVEGIDIHFSFQEFEARPWDDRRDYDKITLSIMLGPLSKDIFWDIYY